MHDRRRVCRKRLVSRNHLVQHDAHREDVSACVEDLTACLFRGHVRDRPRDEAVCAERRLCRVVRGERGSRQIEFGKTEVEQLHQAIGPDHHILGLDVAVNDSGAVRSGKTGGHLHCEIEDFEDRQPIAIQPIAEGRPLDKLHRDEQPAVVGVAQSVDCADVWMIQGGRRTGFLLQCRDARGICGQVRRQELYRDLPAEAEISRKPDLTHATCGDFLKDFVVGEASAEPDVHSDSIIVVVEKVSAAKHCLRGINGCRALLDELGELRRC